MARVFISYRRADSQTITGRIYDRLLQAFDRNDVFKDVDIIPPGSDFPTELRMAVQSCKVQLVIIGPQWASIVGRDGRQRLADPEDFVRQEVEMALRRSDATVIPVLVQGAEIPSAELLPEGLLQKIPRLNAIEIRDDPDFHRDMDRLIRHLNRTMTAQEVEDSDSQRVEPAPRRRGWVSWLIAIVAIIMMGGVLALANGPMRDRLFTTSTPHPLTEIAINNANATMLAQTATAASWTDTPPPPTPDVTQTYHAFETIAAGTQVASLPIASATMTPNNTLMPTSTVSEMPTPSPLDPAPTPVAQNADWTPVIETFDGVEMVLVPAGCFMMGSEDGDIDERLVHEVCFNAPFWIDRYEVTNGQFAQFDGQAARSSYFSGDERPCERVTWTEAQAFCDLRGGRLPTEAEWEYTARGPDGLVYPWGNEFVSDNVVWDGNSGGETAVVGSRPGGVSWVGADDLSGNVWEWVADWYGGYTAEAQVNPLGAESGEYRVLRGGSWFDDFTSYLRAANRSRFVPNYSDFNYGFRCVRSQ